MTQRTEPAPRSRVRDNAEERRYELAIDAANAAIVEYRLTEGVIIFTHAETPPEFEGKGYASALARAALDDARKRGLTVIPHCGFIASYMARHPEYKDLLPH